MPSKRVQNATPSVPVVTGSFDALLPKKLSGLENISKTACAPETPSRRRMWIASGAVVLVSTALFLAAFARRSNEVTPPATCKVIAASEIAENIMQIQLGQPTGKQNVWVGNYAGVLQAHPVPGHPATYSVETAGYLHNDVIGVYVGNTMCSGRFDIGDTRPGDEQFFVG